MSDILQKIAAYKKEEIAKDKAAYPLSVVDVEAQRSCAPRGFIKALKTKRDQRQIALIAEIKKASPSKGLIRADFDPPALAKAYQAGGAACLSVLTDAPSFQGSLDYMLQARKATSLPVLRKDFMFDTYQVAQARAWDADCILIILAAVDDALAKDLHQAARAYDMDVLVEVHNAQETERALKLGAIMIGINNRNLHDFSVDIGISARLLPMIPQDILTVSESGLRSPNDLATLSWQGVGAFLIGETLMREQDVETATRTLLSESLAFKRTA